MSFKESLKLINKYTGFYAAILADNSLNSVTVLKDKLAIDNVYKGVVKKVLVVNYFC